MHLSRVDVNRLPNTIRLQVRVQGEDSLSEVQRMYWKAMQLAEIDREQAAGKFQTLVDLLREVKQDSSENLICFESAKHQMETLRASIKLLRTRQIEEIEALLKRADEVRQTSDKKADTMIRAIIDLYGDKPWAKEQVQRARSTLGKAVK